MEKNLKKFYETTGHSFAMKDDKPYYKGWLYLRGTGITSLPDGLTVGGSLYLSGTGITDTSNVKRSVSAPAAQRLADLCKILALIENRPIIWEWSGRKYLKVDGVFTVLDSHKGNVYHVHALGSDKQMYAVTDGDGQWSHGGTLQEARADLIYKINGRDTSAYKKLSLDDELTFEEAIAAYRTITGACSAGTCYHREGYCHWHRSRTGTEQRPLGA